MYQTGTSVNGKDLNWDSIKHVQKFDVQRSSSPPDQIWAKRRYGSVNSILMYQLGTFVNQIELLGQCEAFLKT